MACDVTVVILTLDEEANLPYALASVKGWAREVIVVDSNSTDDTAQVAQSYSCTFVRHAFESHAKQRNFALSLPMQSQWVFFLDADEWLTQELKDEISARIAEDPVENGFFVKWRMIWMGKWIRRGYYPTWILRLFRRGTAACEERSVNEHLVVQGKTGFLENDFIHQDRKGVESWIRKHIHYAAKEAQEQLNRERNRFAGEIDARFWGTQAQRKRWLRYRIWDRLPLFGRPFIYFFYRLVIRGGFLDGREAFIYHFLHALWFPFIVDAKYLELKKNSTR